MSVQKAWRWLKVHENYFTASLLVFAASFIVLPTSKQVNNVFYLGMLLPAIIFLMRQPRRFLPQMPETWGWCLFFLLAAASGFWGEAGEAYFKHIGYVLVFVLVVSNLSSAQLFSRPAFKRATFWIVAAYIFLSSMAYWAAGTYGVGERTLWLPGRMTGPIYTTMWLVACFALASSVWLQERRYLELAAALALSLFCAIFLLHSRSGLVGLAVLPIFLLLWDLKRWNWRLVLSACGILAVLVTMLWGSGALDAMISRGDALRFIIWRQHLADWLNCGIVSGCGMEHREVFFMVNGNQLKAHSHNIFLSLGVRLGLLPLLVFGAIQGATLWRAHRNADSWGLYLAVSLVMLCFDGDLVISSPNELWLLIWLPAALIVNQNRPNKIPYAPR